MGGNALLFRNRGRFAYVKPVNFRGFFSVFCGGACAAGGAGRRLFVAQGFDGVEQGGLAGGPEAKDNADEG